MPLYEYECRKCKRHFEKIRKFSDAPLVKCEVCGGKLDQLISSPAVQFKGTGWYVTDYARKPAAGNDKSATESAPAAKTSGDGDAKKPAETKKTTESTPAETKK
ncbi:MAG: FmdB family zinc ribbon protein [Terriglobia bacterium]